MNKLTNKINLLFQKLFGKQENKLLSEEFEKVKLDIENDIYQEIKPINYYEDDLFEKYGYSKLLNNYNVKILIITDTHNCLMYDKETIETIKTAQDCDCCLLLGDHTANDIYELQQIISNEKIYGILGNHDPLNRLKDYQVNDINGQVINIKGLKIAAIGGTFKYKDSNKNLLYTHEESIELAEKMQDADILISHDIPYLNESEDEAHNGMKGITNYIYKNKIPLHVHGHLHENSEVILKNGCKSIGIYKCRIIQL